MEVQRGLERGRWQCRLDCVTANIVIPLAGDYIDTVRQQYNNGVSI